MHRVSRQWSIVASCALVALACTASGDPGPDVAPPPGATVDDAALVAADTRVDEWIAHGRTYDEQRYSPLDQITTENVSQLGLAWSFDPETNRGLEATPIVVDGVMYTTGSWSVVFALDAA
ncbi:MAG TPA: PQQ-dependent dehydrogenase, methanol/ethanol family, partial [Thermoanaerobaculia bacterium]|nr:PQQ-dependent dehydrogenase, methanol/ethanol family [Thermoanaerobaculia bacterium]